MGVTPRCPNPDPPGEELDSLCLPGCLSLSGPSTVMGIEGGSLSVQCRYEEEYINDNKYWDKSPCFLSWKPTVETTESAREVRRGRVSIRDDPANLTFTVTLERLTEEDAGTYCCGITAQFSVDPTHEVEVVVFPGEPRTPPLTPSTRSPRLSGKKWHRKTGPSWWGGVASGRGHGACLRVRLHTHLLLPVGPVLHPHPGTVQAAVSCLWDLCPLLSSRGDLHSEGDLVSLSGSGPGLTYPAGVYHRVCWAPPKAP